MSLQLKDIELLSPAEQQLILRDWNATEQVYLGDQTLQQLFEAQVQRTPDQVAVIYEDTELSYAELNRRANQLACYLRDQHQVQGDDLVALCLDRSPEMIIVILAVLKAGGAYVPIDPSYPDERMAYILADTRAKVVICQQNYAERLASIIAEPTATITSTAVMTLDALKTAKQLAALPADNLPLTITSRHLAYVIYTSGTTGQPKGVMIEHKGVVNLQQSLNQRYQLGAQGAEVILQFANYVFDVSVEQITLALLNGHKLLLIPQGLWQQTEDFYDYLNCRQVTYLNATPSFLENYDWSRVKSLEKLIVGGEALTRNLYDKLASQLNNINIINSYGPTEITVSATVNFIQDRNYLSIGRPIANTRVYVLDAALCPVPVGAVGELYIGGVGLARGYLNRPELTAKRFIVNPFQNAAEHQGLEARATAGYDRLYKTGDLVRWLPDGNLDYLGRNDFQVKIRGYRIELGEIETALASYPEVRQCIVLAREASDSAAPGHKYLVAYYVAPVAVSQDSLRQHLAALLPEYMVPNAFVHLEALPLTINGKLDRRALPDPEFVTTTDYLAPRTELEAQVCAIWAGVLGLPADQLSITADFFYSGGDSIISIQLVSRLRQQLGLKVSVKDIFAQKTIQRLFDQVLSLTAATADSIIIKSESGQLSGEVNLLPIQQWFFDNDFVAPQHWNQAFVIRVAGSLNQEKLLASITTLIQHHDALRLKYQITQAGIQQYYDSNATIASLQHLDVSTLKLKTCNSSHQVALDQVLTQWQSQFNLTAGPLFQIGYLSGYSDGNSRIWLAFHHLIIDAVSWRIIAEDLQDLYEGKSLSSKGSSYRQWVEAIQAYVLSHQVQQDYWHNVLVDYRDHDILNSLKDVDCQEASFVPHLAEVSLDAHQTQALLQQCHQAYHTQINDLLLTALAQSLYKLTGQSVQHLLLEGHGREEIAPDLDISRTVGWFTSMYPVRLEVGQDIGQSIKSVKETLRLVPDKGIGYGALFGYHNNQLPQISFNYLGQLDQGVSSNNKTQIKPWQIVDEASGQTSDSRNNHSLILDINGSVIAGQLSLSIASKLTAEATQILASLFQDKLDQLINHCQSLPRSYWTMSDFTDFEPYVSYNEDKKAKRLFIFPPGEGGAESYFNNLVPELKEYNLVLFNNYHRYMIENKDYQFMNDVTFEQLASEYITYIKSIQTTGPYHLCGWSFGGVLAFEIMRQLTEQGDKVNNLILIDAYFDYKSAILFSVNKEQIHNINYKYSPKLIYKIDTNIMLFKASQPTERLSESQYYCSRTQSNHLSRVTSGNALIDITKMPFDHYSWIHDKINITKIANRIRLSMN